MSGQANKLKVAAWCLYDFANSTFSAVIMATVYSVYFIKHVVGNEDGAGDFWWAVVVASSALLIAFSSPIVGAVADWSGARRLLFATYTGVAVVATGLLSTVKQGDVVWGCIVIIVANVGMEGAIIFYNSYLPEIVPRERIGTVSGWGFGVGYAGSVLGLLASVQLVEAGHTDKVGLLVALLFGVFALPAIIILGPGGQRVMGLGAAASKGVTQFVSLVRDVFARKQMRRFLIAYFLYMNGVNTAIFFAGSFAATTFNLPMPEIIVVFLIVQVSALIGSIGLSWATDKLGAKRVVQVSLVIWLGTIAFFVLAQDVTTFKMAAVAAGFGLGTVQAASRALMASLIPHGKEGEFFGFYALCGKSSAPVGAMVFGSLSGLVGQRMAVAAVALFIVAGLMLLARVRQDVEGAMEAA